MQIQEILVVKNAHENYGISTEDINQISRVPLLMPLPLRPSGVRGLCSFSGSVVSMVDMNLLLNMKEVNLEDHKSRLISLNGELASNTLLVSDVYNTVEIKQENIDYIDKENDPVIAIYKHEGMLIQVLSLKTLFERMNRVEIPAREVVTGKIKNEISKEEASDRFLVFSMSQEKYALNIDYLQEIILADVEYTDIAGSSDELLGLITLRDELLMVVDLRVHYGFKAKKSDENRILIISYDGKKIGFCIDSIIDIKSIFRKNIEHMGESFHDSKIAGVIHDEKSLISFFDHNVISEIFRQNATFVDTNNSFEVESQSDTQEYVMEVIVFKLAGKEYAFNVDNVNEIIDNVPSTDVAFTDKSIDGIINIRGQIVTTVSLFSKLGIPTVVNEESKVVICNISGNSIGFVVDSVSDILGVKAHEIREESDTYFESILYLEGGDRLVLSMDIEKIIKKEQDNG